MVSVSKPLSTFNVAETTNNVAANIGLRTLQTVISMCYKNNGHGIFIASKIPVHRVVIEVKTEEEIMAFEQTHKSASVLDIKILTTNKLKLTMDVLMKNVDMEAISPKELDIIIQHSREAGDHFTHFLKTVGKLIVEEKTAMNIIRINRKILFDPVQFMQHQGLEIEEQDERSIMLEEIDLSKITLESMLKGDLVISGEEHLKRLKKSGYIRLDARIFQTLWENLHLVPDHWRGTEDSPKHIFFDGTILKNEHGRYVISMFWDKNRNWRWTYCRLDIGGWTAEDLSAVLKKY